MIEPRPARTLREYINFVIGKQLSDDDYNRIEAVIVKLQTTRIVEKLRNIDTDIPSIVYNHLSTTKNDSEKFIREMSKYVVDRDVERIISVQRTDDKSVKLYNTVSVLPPGEMQHDDMRLTTKSEKIGGGSIRETPRQMVWVNTYGNVCIAKCAICEDRLCIWDNWHNSHIRAVNCCGVDLITNLRALCGTCNMRMGDMHMYDYCVKMKKSNAIKKLQLLQPDDPKCKEYEKKEAEKKEAKKGIFSFLVKSDNPCDDNLDSFMSSLGSAVAPAKSPTEAHAKSPTEAPAKSPARTRKPRVKSPTETPADTPVKTRKQRVKSPQREISSKVKPQK